MALLTLGFVGLVALVGCGGNSPTTAPPPATPPAAPGPRPPVTPPPPAPNTPAPPTTPPVAAPAKKWTADELAAAKADVKMTAVEWRKETTNAGWQAKYGGKVIELEGEVWQMNDPNGEGVTISFADAEKKFFSTMAFTADRRLWEKAGVGSKVVVRGTPNNFGGNFGAELRPAVLVSGEPNKAPTLAAVDLAKEAAADVEATEKKYKKTYAFVTGEFVEVRPAKSDPESGVLILKGAADVEVRVGCDKADMPAAKALKPGAKVKAYGEVNAGTSDEKKYVGVGGSFFKAE